MFLLSFARVIKFSFQDIFRNIWLSLVTVTILVLALFSINMLLVVNMISKATISSIKERVDVNIYLKTSASDEDIMALKAQISNLDHVKEVDYVSKADAMESFRTKHKNDPEILEALRELGQNPLTPSLIIKARDPNHYDDLINELNGINNDIIESRNFDDHRTMLDKVNSISSKVTNVGILLSSIFIFITLLVVYNGIRVAIYTHRREIAIMKLVGASNWFVRAPFLISGLIYALFGVLVIIAIFYPFLTILQPYLEAFFIGYDVNLLSYFNHNFFLIFGLEFAGGALINMFASLIAVGKYSRV